MVNNNTQQKTTLNVNTTSESSIYLKKSELPKNISSFRNDVGYISSAALSTWLKEHSYISKNEINTLIKKANLVVVDTVNKITDDDAIARLNTDILGIKGEIVAIKDRLIDVETGTISSDKEGSFALKSEIPTKVSQLTNDVKYAKKSEIPDISNLATKDEIPSTDGFVTESWVESKKYLTKHQSLSNYAKKSDIPDLSGFATQAWVEEQGYLSDKEDIYAKKSDLNGYVTHSSLSNTLTAYAKKNSVYDKAYINSNILSKVEASNIYPTKTAVADKYITKTDVSKEYLKIEDYRGIKDATVISTEYETKTLDDLTKDIQALRNGFYIVNNSDIVIVKDHQIFNIFKDGVPETTLRWREE